MNIYFYIIQLSVTLGLINEKINKKKKKITNIQLIIIINYYYY